MLISNVVAVDRDVSAGSADNPDARGVLVHLEHDSLVMTGLRRLRRENFHLLAEHVHACRRVPLVTEKRLNANANCRSG